MPETFVIWSLNINFRKKEYLALSYKKNLIIVGKTMKNISDFKCLESELQKLGEKKKEEEQQEEGQYRH